MFFCLCVCVCIQITVWRHLLSTWRATFSISCKVGLIATILFFHLEMYFIFIFEGEFPGHRILSWQFFLQAFWMCYSPAFWPDEKSTANFIGVPLLSNDLVFSCCFKKFLLIFDFQHFYRMCLDLLEFTLLWGN